MKHLLSITDLQADDIRRLLDLADHMAEVKLCAPLAELAAAASRANTK